MEAGLAKSIWEIEDLAALIEAEELRAIRKRRFEAGKIQIKNFRLIDWGAVQFPPMKRLRRWLFNRLAVLSLLVCILWLAIGTLSMFRQPWVIRTNRQSQVILMIPNGFIRITYQHGPGMVAKIGARPDRWEFGCSPQVKGILWEWWLRPRYFSRNGIPNFRVQHVFVPIWFLVLVSGIPWACRRIWKRLHYRAPGSCHVCGYDLRATPDRCPECGIVPTKP